MDAVAEITPDAIDRRIYRRYWMALYRRDVAVAEDIVVQCLRHWRPEKVYLRLFEPALGMSGSMWAKGCITHQDEHFITYHTMRFLRWARHRMVPAETFGPLAMVTGAGQESHLVGLRMVCDFLQADGWRIHWLSSNDRGTVRQAVAALQPRALLLSIGLDEALVHATRLISDLRRHGFDGIIVAGGSAINRDPARIGRIGADLTAPNGLVLTRLLRTFRQPPLRT